MFIKLILAVYFIFNFNIKEVLSQGNNEINNLLRIAAIVNDEPITMMDLDARIRLIIVSSNLPNNIETKKNLSGQVLQSLISEKLQHQEAKKLGIRVTEQEVKNNIRFIEKENNRFLNIL